MISKSRDRLDFQLTRSIELDHDIAASVPSLHRAPNPGDALQSDRPRDTGAQRAPANERKNSVEK